MSHSFHLPPSSVSIQCKTNQKKQHFEPPMHTDAHRLKADKEQRHSKNTSDFFIMSLSVFIGVHRWLKVFVFDLLNPNLSVCSSHRHDHLLVHQFWHHQTADPEGVTMSYGRQVPPNHLARSSTTDKRKKLFEPPMHTDAHRLKADKEKGLLKNLIFFFIKFLSVFIGAHRWLKVFVFDLLNPNLSVCPSHWHSHLPAHQLRHHQTADPEGVTMSYGRQVLPNPIARSSTTDKRKKLFEPPMHTDAHRLKADKKEGLLKNSISFFIKSLSVFIGVYRWLKVFVFDLLNPNLSVCPSHWHSHLPAHQLRHHQTADPEGVTMSYGRQVPPNHLARSSTTDKRKKLFEPPMHTDAHRLKADKEKGLFKNSIFFFIKSLSVFIGVYRWLKVFVFDLLNPNLSVCQFCGSL